MLKKIGMFVFLSSVCVLTQAKANQEMYSVSCPSNKYYACCYSQYWKSAQWVPANEPLKSAEDIWKACSSVGADHAFYVGKDCSMSSSIFNQPQSKLPVNCSSE